MLITNFTSSLTETRQQAPGYNSRDPAFPGTLTNTGQTLTFFLAKPSLYCTEGRAGVSGVYGSR